MVASPRSTSKSQSSGYFLTLDLENLCALATVKIGDSAVDLILGITQTGDHAHAVCERPSALTVNRDRLALRALSPR